MKLVGVCHICGKPAMQTCSSCGLVACHGCIEPGTGFCQGCSQKTISDHYDDEEDY